MSVRRKFGMLALCCALLGCSTPGHSAKPSLDPFAQIKADLAFTCRHERYPEPTADTDTLFHYARWLEKNNQLKRDPAVYAEVERLYRIAAENGRAKANTRPWPLPKKVTVGPEHVRWILLGDA